MARLWPLPTCPAMPGCATAVHSTCVEPLHPLPSQQQVESALVAHKTVAEAAVVGYNHPIKGQGIWAYVTLKEVGCTSSRCAWEWWGATTSARGRACGCKEGAHGGGGDRDWAGRGGQMHALLVATAAPTRGQHSTRLCRVSSTATR